MATNTNTGAEFAYSAFLDILSVLPINHFKRQRRGEKSLRYEPYTKQLWCSNPWDCLNKRNGIKFISEYTDKSLTDVVGNSFTPRFDGYLDAWKAKIFFEFRHQEVGGSAEKKLLGDYLPKFKALPEGSYYWIHLDLEKVNLYVLKFQLDKLVEEAKAYKFTLIITNTRKEFKDQLLMFKGLVGCE